MDGTPADDVLDSSALPIYYRLQNALLNDLLRTLEPGDKLPTEVELCEKYEVSRSTIRKALDHFTSQGYIERFKGRGTYLIKKFSSATKPSNIHPNVLYASPFQSINGVLATTMSVLESAAMRLGYSLTIANLTHELPVLRDFLRRLAKTAEPSGIILWPIDELADGEQKNRQVVETIMEMDIPLVVIDKLLLDGNTDDPTLLRPQLSSANYDFVIPDNYYGGQAAARHLLDMGHAALVYVGGHPGHAGLLRQRGFESALKERGITAGPESVIRLRDLIGERRELGRTIQELVAKGVTAVQAENDFIAREIIYQAEQVEIEVPRQLSVIGYDNLDFCDYLSVPLTTIRQPVELEVQLAIDILVGNMLERSTTLRHVVLPVELVSRSSTAQPSA